MFAATSPARGCVVRSSTCHAHCGPAAVRLPQRLRLPLNERAIARNPYGWGTGGLVRPNTVCRVAAVDVLERVAINTEPASVEDGLYTVKGTLRTTQSASAVYSLLTDYEGASQIFRKILSSSVVERDGYKLVKQVAEWKFLLLSGNFEIMLMVEESPAQCRIVFKAEDSTFMQDFQGRWSVMGAGYGAGCLVEYVLSVRLAMPFPVGITGRIFEQQVLEVLEDLKTALHPEDSQ